MVGGRDHHGIDVVPRDEFAKVGVGARSVIRTRSALGVGFVDFFLRRNQSERRSSAPGAISIMVFVDITNRHDTCLVITLEQGIDQVVAA